MRIIDNENLIPDKAIIEVITREHPLCENLCRIINNLIIEPSAEPTEKINLDPGTQNVTLYIFKETPPKRDYEFILYYEFSHIADKLNPGFKYSDEKWNSLTEREQRGVQTLWNCFINARLNERNLFQIIHINAHLGEYMDFLESLSVNNAQQIIEEIWYHPSHFLSLEDMIAIFRINNWDWT